ncbi:MAG: hypothetical protein ACPGYX_12890 [Oceanobacter sp.]
MFNQTRCIPRQKNLRLVLLLAAGSCIGAANIQALEAADPTRPPNWLAQPAESETPVASSPLVLQQVLLKKNPAAVINGELLLVGDLIQGYRIARIQAGKVTLQKGQKRQILSLLNRQIRKSLATD